MTAVAILMAGLICRIPGLVLHAGFRIRLGAECRCGMVPIFVGPLVLVSGLWIHVDFCGTWGWLPYHYGGWDFVPGVGWMWFPGNVGVWSPGLVTWYTGPDGLGGCRDPALTIQVGGALTRKARPVELHKH